VPAASRASSSAHRSTIRSTPTTGVLDGRGLNGDDYYSGNGAAGITFTFSAAALGALP
jgi:hypothetical protein